MRQQAQQIAAAVIDRIRQRGYWSVVIHPGRLAQACLPLPALSPLLAEAAVRLRGWEFPRTASVTPQTQLDYIETDAEYDYYLEYWRFYQSGQFVNFHGMTEDWRDRSAFNPAPPGWGPGLMLPIIETVYHLTEIFEFAARLAFSPRYYPGEQVRIEVGLHNLEGRQLIFDVPKGMPLPSAGVATTNDFTYAEDLATTEIVAEADRLALRAAEQLFQRFQWEPSPGFLATIQRDLLDK